jgi:hypothetical protein
VGQALRQKLKQLQQWGCFAKMKKFTKNQKIALWSIVVVVVTAVVGWTIEIYLSHASVQITSNNNSGIIAPNNSGNISQNQLAKYTWTNSDSWQNTWDSARKTIVLQFSADTPLFPKRACFGIATDVQVNDIGPDGLTENQTYYYNNKNNNPPLLTSMLCFDELNFTENVYVTFERMPTVIKSVLQVSTSTPE